MFTQCENCKAIFRVTLREITTTKGKLRCGECYSVFDATKTLSNTIPTPFQEVVDLESTAPVVIPKTKKRIDNNREAHTISIHQSNESSSSESTNSSLPYFKEDTAKPAQTFNKWLLISVLFLALLLALQIYFNIKFKATEEPRHEPEKIQMLSYNVFAHPNESGVLLISATLENIAKFKQPYPIIELRLSDSKSKVIALRRFRPSEYLQNQAKGLMLSKNQQSKIKLKIKDPGSQATRFQFKFY